MENWCREKGREKDWEKDEKRNLDEEAIERSRREARIEVAIERHLNQASRHRLANEHGLYRFVNNGNTFSEVKDVEKETAQKKNNLFIIRDHYRKDGAKARDLMEREIYKRIINNLG